MFGIDNFAPKLDEYKAFYSVEPPWIEQMKRVEASDKQLQAGALFSKRDVNSLFSMMGNTASRLHDGAGGGGARARVAPTTTQSQSQTGGGSARILIPGEPNQSSKRPRNLPALGTPMSGDSDTTVNEGETNDDGNGSAQMMMG